MSTAPSYPVPSPASVVHTDEEWKKILTPENTRSCERRALSRPSPESTGTPRSGI